MNENSHIALRTESTSAAQKVFLTGTTGFAVDIYGLSRNAFRETSHQEAFDQARSKKIIERSVPDGETEACSPNSG